MSDLSNRLRDLVPHVRGTGLDGKGHVLAKESADALDAMEAALKAIMSNTSRQSAIWAIASQALAKLEGK